MSLWWRRKDRDETEAEADVPHLPSQYGVGVASVPEQRAMPLVSRAHTSALLELPSGPDRLGAAITELLSLCAGWNLPLVGIRRLLLPAVLLFEDHQPLDMWVSVEDELLTVELYAKGSDKALYGIDHWLP